MAGRRSIVLTGYGDWEKSAPNPAEQVMNAVAAMSWSDHDFTPITVPVETDKLMPLVEVRMRELRPDLWIGLGVVPAESVMRIEAVGINSRDFSVPDNNGVQLDGVPVVEEGPAAYYATVPCKAMTAAMRAGGVPTITSYHAATHMCNQMLYSSLHVAARAGLATRCGFVHVPFTPEFVAHQEPPEDHQPSMELSRMAEGVRIAIETALAALDGEAGVNELENSPQTVS